VTPQDSLRPILATARELYGRVVYTHKTHEKEREIWSRKVSQTNQVNIGLTGLTTVAAVISASLKPTWALITTALLAAGTVCFAIWQSSFDPAGKEGRHRVAAKELLWMREQLLLLITNCQLANADSAQLQQRLEAITQELTTAYKFVPDTSFEAYSAAEKALKSGHFTFSDEEIDGFLPTHLRSAPLPPTTSVIKTDRASG
jgi:hypothetical protein